MSRVLWIVILSLENVLVKPATLATNVVNAKVATTRMTLPDHVSKVFTIKYLFMCIMIDVKGQLGPAVFLTNLRTFQYRNQNFDRYGFTYWYQQKHGNH